MILLCSASIITASMVSIFLGSTMVGVILLSKKYNVNPDNIATPVAGSMGDLVTLGMLSIFAKFIWSAMKSKYLLVLSKNKKSMLKISFRSVNTNDKYTTT